MADILTTYTGTALNGALNCPPLGIVIPFAGTGSKGIARVNVRMETTRSVVEIAMDGAAVPSKVPGKNGRIEVEMFQNSTFHAAMVAWYNALDTADDGTWFATSVTLINTATGRAQYCTGVAPEKVPDTPNEKQARTVTWTLVAANIEHE